MPDAMAATTEIVSRPPAMPGERPWATVRYGTPLSRSFASIRQGADLSDILGIRQAILAPRTDEGGDGPVSSSDEPAGGIDPNCKRRAR
jgi:hypothetical protein